MQKILKLMLIALLTCLSACAQIQTNRATALEPLAPGIIIATKPVGQGYYALVEKIDGRWQVMEGPSSQPITRRANDDQEILFVNGHLHSIAPVFDRRLTGHSAHCTPAIDDSRFYWLCTSYFSSVDIAYTILRDIFSCAMTFCLAAGTSVSLDHEKLQQVALESGLLDKIKDRTTQANYQTYSSEFSEAFRSRDIEKLQQFVSRYRENDPDQLVQMATAKIQRLKQFEAAIAELNRILDEAKQNASQSKQ
jgi:hypothetical protein